MPKTDTSDVALALEGGRES